MKFDVQIIKRHPLGVTAAVLIGGLLVWYFLLRSSPAPAQSANSDYDPEANSPAGLQAAQIAGSLAAASQQAQAQLAIATLGAQASLQNDAYNYQLGTQNIQSQTQIAMAQLQTQLQEQEAGYAASITEQSNQIAGNVSLATINANLQEQISATTAQLQSNLAQYQSQDFQAQLINSQIINGQNVDLAETNLNDNARTAQTQAWTSAIGGIVGAFL